MSSLSIKARSLVLTIAFFGCVLVLAGVSIWGVTALEAAADTDAAAAGLIRVAGQLAENSEGLRNEIDRFMRTLRQAV
jgi:hypothetical protein